MYIINELQKNIKEAVKETEKFGVELKETSIENRNIFKIKEDKYEKCYEAMIGILNENKKYVRIITEDNELKSLRRLLREVWKKYENKLKVHNYLVLENKEKKGFYEDDTTHIWGVGINLEQDVKNDWDPEEKEEIGWRVAYHTIFHEFFHNIDHAANPKEDEYFSVAYKNNEFGKTVEIEIKKLFDEENDKNKKTSEKRLNKLTFNTPKREKAALYDLMGGVLYRGKYGCYPPNSEFYNKGKDGKGEKCKVRFLCSTFSDTKTETANCKYKERCNPQECRYGKEKVENGYKCFYGINFECYKPYENKVYSDKTCNLCANYKGEKVNKKCFPNINKCRYRCNNAGACPHNYKTECDLKTTDWCNKIFGHGSDYWGEKPKKNDPSTPKFLECLATEAFAHMAAEAITNPKAYENIKKCLPESEKMFREIIRKILREELKKFYELWA